MKDLINEYITWLKDKISFIQLTGGWSEVTTPFLNHSNDHIQLYVKNNGDGTYKISDNAEILSNLSSLGLKWNEGNSFKELITILNGFGLKYDQKSGEIFTFSTVDTFPRKKHSMIQALLSIDDLHVLSQSKSVSTFSEDVEKYFAIHNIRYVSDIFLPGSRSGFPHKIDFLIPASSNSKERIIKLIISPNKQSIERYLFSMIDTQESRNSVGIAFMNDSNKSVNDNIMSACRQYDIIPFPWSLREDSYYLDLVAA